MALGMSSFFLMCVALGGPLNVRRSRNAPAKKGVRIRPSVIPPVDELRVSKSALRRGGARFQPSRRNGHPRLVISAIVLLQGVFLTGFLRRRSRRRYADEDAQALRRRLLAVHEDERRALARALHDDIAQRLAGLALDAAKLPAGSLGPSIRDGLEKLALDIDDLSYRLYPSVIDDLGLVAALKVECDRIAASESLRMTVDADAIPQGLPKDLVLGVYRVAQEALRNASRHAKASTIRLSLMLSDGGLLLSVSDDGIGFDPDLHAREPSLGHASMRGRIDLLGGTLDIRSAPGRGTTIGAWVPIPEAHA
jgi:signal transduction histidine kinase